jgi:hypothetical protein
MKTATDDLDTIRNYDTPPRTCQPTQDVEKCVVDSITTVAT